VQLVVGRVGRPHGVNGEVTVEVRTDDVDHRFAAGAVLDTDPPERGPLTIVRARPHSGRLLVAFADMTDREGAEALRGTLLVADSATSAVSEDPEEYWDHDLVGLAAVTTSGEKVGEVIEVLHLPAQDVLVVRRDEADEVLVPFVAAIVPAVDPRGGRVVIDPPAGLLDGGAD
jgi:16S rRNA processing protein RimM